MAELFSPDTFCDSALDFARTAPEAHHAENYRRVALEAGTALEHLAKAAQARRSRALLAELKNDSSAAMIAWLLRVDGAKPPPRIRTIGLWEALTRVRPLVSSTASYDDLRILVDMRDGVVHAAQDAEIEARILTAFAPARMAASRSRASCWAMADACADCAAVIPAYGNSESACSSSSSPSWPSVPGRPSYRPLAYAWCTLLVVPYW